MGTVACLFLPSAQILNRLFQELQKWMMHTDVVIGRSDYIIPAVITAGEKVFEALSSISS